MASTKISALPAASALTGSEIVPGVQSGANVGATVQQLVTAATGSSAMTGGTVTASTPLLNHAQTWNNAGINFTGWKLDITNTASGGSSLLADFRFGGSSKATIGTDGSYTTSGGVVSGFVTTGTKLRITTGASFEVIAAGLTTTGYLGFAAANSATSGPDIAMTRTDANGVQINNGTAGSFRDLKLRNLLPQVFTVATLPSASTAGAGARSHVSDASAPSFGATVASGGSVSTPVYSDGTNWKVG